MKKIRTWRERCQDFDDGHITTSRDIERMMQSEIDDLRALLEMLRDSAAHPSETMCRGIRMPLNKHLTEERRVTKKWSSTASGGGQTKRQASKASRRAVFDSDDFTVTVEDSCGCIWCDIGFTPKDDHHETAKGSFLCTNRDKK